jgi:predicted metallo-beta-lactamase superfamily hydrolase
MATVVEAAGRTVLIDPGVALAPRRFGLPPHPCETRAAAEIRRAILAWLPRATDVAFTHYHGDHVPLREPDPGQIALDTFTLPEGCRILAKGPDGLSRRSRRRRSDLEKATGMTLQNPEGTDDGVVACSPPVPHGGRGGEVMMAAVREGDRIFVHASDTQLFSDEALRLIEAWGPTVVFSSGPPLYLPSIDRAEEEEEAFSRAIHGAEIAGTLILDHHLMRSENGPAWIRDLGRGSGRPVVSAAEFMGWPNRLLEAGRRELWSGTQGR